MINLPETGQERIVIVGGGFGGLKLARRLRKSDYQVVLLDKNNFHQFQPLFYQVAMAGLEPSSIVFPFRKLFQGSPNVFFRIVDVERVEPERKRLHTNVGIVNYDHLVLAMGADTNFFGNETIAEHAIPMKSVSEALFLRNRILADLELALMEREPDERRKLMDIVIVGGGPTGVEVAGALAEMRKYVLPKDYPELNAEEMDIFLLEGLDQLLAGMSEAFGEQAKTYLEGLGVEVRLNAMVTEYDGETVVTQEGQTFRAYKLIWAAGIRGNILPGLPKDGVQRGNRLKVDRHFRLEGSEDLYAIGDLAYMEEPDYPQGHPQVAQVALQHAEYLTKWFRKKDEIPPFHYRDKGSMATIGRSKAVVDLPGFHFRGFAAWIVWLFVHLFQLIGAKNKVFVFINWVWNYLFYDQSLRLILRAKEPKKKETKVPV